ncbi:MAG: hypothetical protein Q8L15_18520 [Methylobacter sp.]|nr:hypothetical protein [Methylobacter sp.]
MSLSWYYTGGGSSTSVLGGQISSAALAETQGIILPNVDQSAGAVTGVTHYACICIKNTGAVSIANAGVYFSSVVTGANVSIAKGLTGKNSTTEQVIASNTTIPTGALVFQNPLFSYSALMLGTLAAGDFYHLWLKRVVKANLAGSPNDYLILSSVES